MAKKQASAKKKTAVQGKQAMVVTVSGDRPIHEVTRDLTAAGFEVGQVLDVIGSVTGYAQPKVKKRLQMVRGVADVSDDHPIDIGPPGSIS